MIRIKYLFFSLLRLAQFDHGESENRGPKTLGFIISAPAPKNAKKGSHFKFNIL